MAESLSPSGIVVPNADGGEVISATGVEEIRLLGSTVNTALAGKASTEYVNDRAFNQGRVPNGSDIFTLASGSWTVSSTGNAATMINLPEEWPMRLLVQGGEAIVNTISAYPYSRDYTWETSKSALGGWMPWRKVDGAGLAPAAQHTIRQSQLLYAMGGPVDTGGLGAVSWRIDHGLTNFRDKLLPIFRAAGIVPMITLNSRDWGRSENAGVTQSEVNGWVTNGWVEISNHGATHENATGNDNIHDFIVGGLTELETQLPAAKGKIFGFCIPGVGVTGAYDGFAGGSTPAQWGTYTGKLILENHAVGYGHLEGTELRVLDGTPRDGMLHMMADARPGSEITAKVDEAIATGRGFQIMTHPSRLDTSGFQTTADVQAIVSHIVAKRDAGELAVLSPYQMMVADSTNPPVTVPDVDDLAARLAAIEYFSGWRNITALMAVQPESGNLFVCREGRRVWIHASALKFADSASFVTLTGLLPTGWRPARITDIPMGRRSSQTPGGSFRVNPGDGTSYFYYVAGGQQIDGSSAFLTLDPIPAPGTEPGSPA